MARVPSNGRPHDVPRDGFQSSRAGRPRSAVAVALCAGLLAGCGSSNASGSGDGNAPSPSGAVAPALPADQAQKPACGLVTQAEVEAAIGARVGPGKEQAEAGRSLCTFALVSAADQSVVLVSTSSSGVPAAFDAARAKVGSPQSVGAGDQAFVSGAQAMVRRGNTMVAILVVLRQQAAQLTAAATKLAQAVGARL